MAPQGKHHWAAVLACLAGFAPMPSIAQVTLIGRVVDENSAPVRGAVVTIRHTGPAARSGQAETNATGAFTISVPEPGAYLINVERQGFYPLRDHPIQVEPSAPELTLTLNTVREIFQSVNVDEQVSPLEQAATSNQSRLSGTEVNDIPYANSHSLRNGLQLVPEIVQDPGGALHLNGAAENQTLYVLNGFNLTNPISGQLQTTLAVEGIRSIDVSSGRYSPEFGKGSAGVLAINTVNGTDKFHYTATDFIPGLSSQHGLHLGNWYPRVGISGPIVRGKAWFSDMLDFEYNQSVISGLPANQNTRSGLLASNLLHTQFNLSSANILFADFLLNIDNEGRIGLGSLNPVSTTSQVNTRQYFGSIKDQISFSRGALIEFGYGHTNFSTTQTPQGSAVYVFGPQGNTGNYFLNSSQSASRDEWLSHGYAPHFHFLGEHQLEGGADGELLHETGDFRRTGYQVLGLSNQLISETLFGSPAHFGVSDAQADWWLLDTWHVTKRLQFTPGIRQDWDQLIGAFGWSPRLGFSWSPFSGNHTRISGGYAITRDTVTMDLFGYPLDQIAMTTTYNANGTPVGAPQATTFITINSHLAMPRAGNWNLDLDEQLTQRLTFSARYLRRRGSDELIYSNSAESNLPPSLLPIPAGAAAGTYQLTNLRRDDFDSVQVSARQTFSGQYEWMATYTHSKATSNALVDPNTPEPVQVLNYPAPLPWDAPNRLLAFAYLPLPVPFQRRGDWSVAILANLRSGFPYSVRDQTGLVQGTVDSFRYSTNFDLNLAIERMFTLHGYRFALRGGVDNLTNQLNATAVNNVLGAPNFGKFLGGEGRHYVLRVRFFGRAEAPPGGSGAGPRAPKTPAPPHEPDTSEPAPAASIYGNTGLWKVFTADTLAPHQIAASTWYDRINRNPGDLVISTYGFGGAIGLTSRIEFGISFEANRDVSTGREDELSFGQEALGFFGNKTPGSPPLASELMPGSSTVPQLRSPANPSGKLTGAAGYFDLFPFAGLVSSASAAGDFLFGVKIKLLSESKGAPVSIAVRPYFDLPVHKAITFLETHPIGTADLQGGFDGIISRDIGDIAEVFFNAGYRYVSQPAHISVFRLAEDAPLGFGLTIPRSTFSLPRTTPARVAGLCARLQFVAESTADIFVGSHTPNTTFGPEDPVDLTIGLRGDIRHHYTFSAGYRRPLNQFGGDKNGFVLSFGYDRR